MAKKKTKKKKKVAKPGPEPRPKPRRTRRPPARGPVTRKVWSIVNHEARLQSTQQRVNILQKSSPYIQLPVRPRSDTPDLILFSRQLAALLDRDETRIAWMRFWLIAAWSYDTEIQFKGLLLGLTRKPAATREIAAQMYCDPVAAKRTLAALERSGLLERIELPDFNGIDPPKSRRAGWRDDKKNDKPATGKKAKKTTAKQNTSRAMARGGTLSRKTAKNKSKLTASGKSAAPPKTKRTANGKNVQTAEPETRLKLHKPGDDQVIEITIPGEAEPPTTPASTPPISPTVADAGQGGGPGDQTRQAPPSPSSDSTGRPSRLDLYDQTARTFAVEVYTRIRTPHTPGTPEANREVANFAAAWADAQTAGLTLDQLSRLWSKSLADATKLGNKRRRTSFRKSAEAVWRHTFNSRLTTQAPVSAAM